MVTPDAAAIPPGRETLRPQDLTLTIFGDYALDRPIPVWSGGVVSLLGSFGFSVASARLALSRVARKGLLERTREGRLTHYSLSQAGTRLLSEGKQRIFSFGTPEEWDGTWTVLSYSIPEQRRAARDKLRKRLSFLGFASFHDGIWFSPRDREVAVAALLDELGLASLAQVFLGRPSDRTVVPELIRLGWDLETLDERYAAFVDEFGRFVRRPTRRGLSDEDAFVTRTRVMHAYRRFPVLDPELPEEIVGTQWRRAEAIQTFRAVYAGLSARAAQHFHTTVSPQ